MPAPSTPSLAHKLETLAIDMLSVHESLAGVAIKHYADDPRAEINRIVCKATLGEQEQGGVKPWNLTLEVQAYVTERDAGLIEDYSRAIDETFTTFPAVDSLSAFDYLTFLGEEEEDKDNARDTRQRVKTCNFHGLLELDSTVGDAFNIRGLSALSDAFDTTNAGGLFTLWGGEIAMSGGSGAFSSRLLTKFSTASSNIAASIDITYGARSSNSNGTSISFEALNTFPASQRSWHAQVNAVSGDGSGLLQLWESSTNGGMGSVVANNADVFPITENSRVRLTIGQDGAEIYAHALNLDTLKEKRCSVIGDFGVVRTYTVPPTSRIAISHNRGSDKITAMSVRCFDARKPRVLCIGDSKTRGYSAGAINARWANLLDLTGWEVVVMAGAGDQTDHALHQIRTFVTEHMVPATVILSIGCNDVRRGVASGTWQANYSAIVSALRDAGARIVHLLPIPEATLNQAELASYITSMYASGDIINPAVGWSNAAHLSSDGVHPNAAGHQLIADNIITSGVIRLP